MADNDRNRVKSDRDRQPGNPQKGTQRGTGSPDQGNMGNRQTGQGTSGRGSTGTGTGQGRESGQGADNRKNEDEDEDLAE